MTRTLYLCAILAGLTQPASTPSQTARSSETQERAQAASQVQGQPASNAQASGTAVSSGKTEPAQAKKPKKVWTEEDMGNLNGKVSVVGNAKPQSASNGSTRTGSSDAASYRSRLAPLREKLERINQQIADLQNAKLGGRDNIARPMERLEAQKKDILAQIDAIEDEARKNGVEAGQLR